MANIHHSFESADTTQTLAEGLREYFAANPMLKRDADLLSPSTRQFFRSHDAVHVVYGCSTTMSDEAVVKIASLFGTTGGTKVLRGYAHREAREIYRNLPIGSTLFALLVSPYLIFRTVWRCTRQLKRWPWEQHEEFLNLPLCELRSQFGIKVAHG